MTQCLTYLIMCIGLQYSSYALVRYYGDDTSAHFQIDYHNLEVLIPNFTWSTLLVHDVVRFNTVLPDSGWNKYKNNQRSNGVVVKLKHNSVDIHFSLRRVWSAETFKRVFPWGSLRPSPWADDNLTHSLVKCDFTGTAINLQLFPSGIHLRTAEHAPEILSNCCTHTTATGIWLVGYLIETIRLSWCRRIRQHDQQQK